MNTIRLYGALGRKFGHQHRYDVSDAAEAVRALAVNYPDFQNEFRKGSYRLIRGQRTRDDFHITPETLRFGLGNADLHIIPALAGSKRGGGKVILGTVIMAAAIASARPWAAASFSEAMAAPAFLGISNGSIALFGAPMMLAGVSQMLTQTPKANTAASNSSHLFSGPVNSTEQGDAIPLIYGECWIGSTVISWGMDSDQTGSASTITTQTTAQAYQAQLCSANTL